MALESPDLNLAWPRARLSLLGGGEESMEPSGKSSREKEERKEKSQETLQGLTKPRHKAKPPNKPNKQEVVKLKTNKQKKEINSNNGVAPGIWDSCSWIREVMDRIRKELAHEASPAL